MDNLEKEIESLEASHAKELTEDNPQHEKNCEIDRQVAQEVWTDELSGYYIGEGFIKEEIDADRELLKSF